MVSSRGKISSKEAPTAPKSIIVNNKDTNRLADFEKIMLKFCLLLTKIVNKTKTQRVHDAACFKTEKHEQRVVVPATVLT